MNILNLPLYQGFVSPALCDQLQRFGVTTDTPFHWRLTGTITELYSFAFDKDDYYRSAYANIDYICQPVGIIPAYQIKDVEKPLPPYLLAHHEKGYVVMCDNLYGLQEQTADRLPDVYAMMLLEGIKKRVIKIDFTNHVITSGNGPDSSLKK